MIGSSGFRSLLALLLLGALGAAAFYVLRNKGKSSPELNPETLARVNRFKPGTFSRPGYAYPLPYRLFAPAAAKEQEKYPLVVVLHGWGLQGEDNVRQVTADVEYFATEFQKLQPSFVLAPQMPSGKKWVAIAGGAPYLNYSEAAIPESDGLKLTKLLIAELQKTAPIDPDRIYVTGFSAGGAGTWDIITRDSVQPFAAAIVVSGAYDPASAVRIPKMPVWLFHGTQDEVSPSSNMTTTVSALQALGSPVKSDLLEGVGHDSTKAYAKEGLMPWLLAQRRSNWAK